MNKKEVFFKNLNEFFDNIYVISLKKSSTRHLYIKEILSGLDFELFWGIDGKKLDRNELQEKGIYHSHLTKLLKKRKGRPAKDLPLPSIGCALSHYAVYNDILDKGYQKALILEDDLFIDTNALGTFEKALNELPDDWQLLYLGHFGSNSDPTMLLKVQKSVLSLLSIFFQKFERLKMIDPDVIRCWFPRAYSENLDRSGTHFGTHSYGVTSEGARIILNYQIPVVQEVDNTIAELCNYEWIKAFSLKKRIFHQNREDFSSTIKD